MQTNHTWILTSFPGCRSLGDLSKRPLMRTSEKLCPALNFAKAYGGYRAADTADYGLSKVCRKTPRSMPILPLAFTPERARKRSLVGERSMGLRVGLPPGSSLAINLHRSTPGGEMFQNTRQKRFTCGQPRSNPLGDKPRGLAERDQTTKQHTCLILAGCKRNRLGCVVDAKKERQKKSLTSSSRDPPPPPAYRERNKQCTRGGHITHLR